jgi:hypothetical protein
MKQLKTFFLFLFAALTISSCSTVDSGHTGVHVSYGGSTNMEQTFEEGIHFGFHWLFDKMIDYDTRETTVSIENTLLDYDGLKVPVKVVLYYSAMPNSVNRIHKQIGPDYEKQKIMPIFEAALKNIIPKYKALELNREYRDKADEELSTYLRRELASVYCDLIRVNITSVDIPNDISEMIIAKQIQDEKNLLAEKINLENMNLGKAKLTKDSLEFLAAEYEAKKMKALSTKANLELKELEIREIEARGYEKHGSSKYGTNNWFGNNSASVLKTLK